MKRLCVVSLLVLGSAGLTAAQTAPESPLAVPRSAKTDLFAAKISSADSFHGSDSLFGNSSAGSANSIAEPAALPGTPAAGPKFIYGSRDDYRWQLGLGLAFTRFRSSIFSASAVGTATSIGYFTNEWFALEGNITTGFAPQIFDREHVKLVTFTGGPKIAWRQRRWEPWAHALFGGMHVMPQTAGNSKTGYNISVGGGTDFRLQPRVSFRFEADYVRTGLFGETQNSASASTGVVFHF